VEPLSFGALCVVSTACGCVGFLERASEGELPPNVIVGDYIGAAPEGDYLQALAIGQVERDRIEASEASRVAGQIATRLPQDDKATRKLLKDGYAMGQRMSWEVVARDYLVPGLRRAAGRAHAAPMVRAPRRPSEMRTLAMILAGGEGTRLSILTRKRAKPAVPFAGKYRIIDFTLSNCVNSGIYRVGILTQYRPRSLNDHIQRGRPWDLDRMTDGVTLLQAYLGRRESDWYQGTADAVHQNLDFIISRKPDVVLVLSGDHVYKMNYTPFIEYHERKGADMTVATINVRPKDAYRFGILVVNGDGRVVEFHEKPSKPKSTLASMGVYIFNLDVLTERLDDDALLSDSPHDFGKDILPRMVERGDRVFAYPFNDYWVDVGAVHAYWEAHMDLLTENPPLDLQDRRWVIHTRSEERPPVNIRTGATVSHSLISDGCIIEGTVEYSVFSPGVRVCPGAVVRHSIVMTDAIIEEMAVVDHAILDKNVIVGKRSHVGVGHHHTPNETQPDLSTGLTLIGKNTHLPPGMKVGRNCLISSDLTERDFPTKNIAGGKTVGDVQSQ
jgi:glucose-1-phosphate adenylyltransferase